MTGAGQGECVGGGGGAAGWPALLNNGDKHNQLSLYQFVYRDVGLIN